MSGVIRFFEMLGAAVLVGGTLATAGIGSLAFGSPDILSRELAGRFMAEVFERSIAVEAAAVGLIALAALLRRAKPVLIACVLGAGLVAGHFFWADGMRAIRERHGGTVHHLSEDHADRRDFRRMHGIYSVLSLCLLLQGVAVLREHAKERR